MLIVRLFSESDVRVDKRDNDGFVDDVNHFGF